MNSTLFYLLHEGSGLPIGGSEAGGLSLFLQSRQRRRGRDSLEDMEQLYPISLDKRRGERYKPRYRF